MTVRYDPCTLHGWHRFLRGNLHRWLWAVPLSFVRLHICRLCKVLQKRVSTSGGSMFGLRWSGGVLTMILAASTPVLTQQPSPAGHVKIVSGSAFIVRQNATVPARPGDAVFASDALRTGVDGTVGVTLKDDTRLSLGPSSEVRLERYVYAPGEGGFGMVLKFVRGVAAYVSGRMAKLAPDSIRLETPASIVGVRGTTVAVRVEP